MSITQEAPKAQGCGQFFLDKALFHSLNTIKNLIYWDDDL